jgi:hypothetical protein
MTATVSAVVVDQKAIGILDRALVEDAWLQKFELPDNSDGLRRVESEGVVYLLSENADISDGYLVVNTAIFAPKTGLAKPRTAFERVIRVALRHFDRSIAIPIAWQTYHAGSRLSVYAQPSRAKQRVYFDQSPDGTDNLYAFAITSNPEDLDGVAEDEALYHRALEGLCDALLADAPPPPPVGNFGVLLSEPLGVRLTSSGTLQEWYEQRLNPKQLEFVNRLHDRPVRLRGAAGTGKTQSMVVKCLRDLYADADGDKTFAFLTHSSALAHNVVRGMLHSLDPTERWSSMKTSSGQPRLWIGTIYELAQEKLGYQKKGLEPLSLDGSEGREYQRILIERAIDQVLKDPRIVFDLFPNCPDFQQRLKGRVKDASLFDDLMNEFACVLDLEAIKKDTSEANRYARGGSREPWQMVLPTEAHRRVVLEVYDVYRTLLRTEKMLSMGQMIADFDAYVGTHEWGALRERDGFDLVFVDEYHYFTRAESMLLHNLFKSRAQVSGRWPLLMAYDIKQATNDVAISGGMEKFRNPGVGESVLTELSQVYRSTPQITAFLRDLDAAFPAMDLEGEYATYVGESQQEDGETPTLSVYDSDIKLIDSVFDQAIRVGRGLDGGGSQVAVLCLNEVLFDKIRVAGRVRDKFVPITTREDLKELRSAKSKCVFSMPEFVAGLQFNTVFLIHADSADYDEDQGQGSRRRYVSRVYLGASRAARKILVLSSKEHGGASQLLSPPLDNGTLRHT